MRTLYGLSYSGWTEKARWALDHHRVAYRYREHLPLIGEPVLRWRTPRGARPSVPLLFDEGEAFSGSFAIARRAEELGQGEPLFSAQDLPSIERWEADSEQVLCVARAKVVAGLLHNRQAQAESLPAFLPEGLRSLLAPSAKLGARFVARKHTTPADLDAATRDTVIPTLERLRESLGGQPYLLGHFSYADVTAAVMLQFVRPVDDRYLPLGPGTREVWTDTALAARFPDLLAWRDGLYAKHRRP
ncbi:glutathione S-transferase family protein [Myxococcus sp. Y35]|uniref:glutathione S-transferase family protein n=1 Tax=Pseudomyxococcus flavus TaxID=3115648 RepID=UPI003CF3FE9C